MAHIVGTPGDDRGAEALYGTSGDDIIQSLQGVDQLFGGDGDDELDGGEGRDWMYGGQGNDIYYVDNAGDQVIELAGQGSDTVMASHIYTLDENLEKLILIGDGNYQGNGNAADNSIAGNAGSNRLNGWAGDDRIGGGGGNDTLDGGIGADLMDGGTGDDRYYVDNAGDVVVEFGGHGTDTVLSSVRYTLGSFVENLTLSGMKNLFGTGNALDNTITGNAGDNTLGGGDGNDVIDGGKGADTLRGGKGDDTFYVDNAGDTVAEYTAQGTDRVYSSLDFILGKNLENLVLTGTADITATGNSLDNLLTGNSGNNSLDGKVGADTMAGGLGDDTYVVDFAGDTVSEEAAGGTDTVRAAISYVLGANLENLTLTGSANTDAAGNDLDNIITGNAGDNNLDGAAGADTMTGGLGNDSYHVDTISDQVFEALGGGNDTVTSSVDYILGNDVENLVLTGAAGRGIGNALDNTLQGNDGNNLLDGKAGADLMSGGNGNDTYIVDNSGDLVVDTGGIDLVRASATFSLGDDQVENLYLMGSANIDATGNGLNNVMRGNAGDNFIDGAGGINTIDYKASSAGVTVDLLAGTASGTATGNDTLMNIQRVQGSDFADTLTGNDLLAGGSGDDTYFVSSASARILEFSSGGTDTVMASVTWTLATNIENLTLTGTGANSGTGNTLDNVLTGNANDNVLDGKAGADIMTGGAGNDTYYVNDIKDKVVENANEGTDTVYTKASFSLVGTAVENLTVNTIGSARVTATGNDLDNIIVGGHGNDTIIGGAGDDILSGGVGLDTFVFAPGCGNDLINDFQPTNDRHSFAYDHLNFSAFSAAGRTVNIHQDGSNLVYDWGNGDVITLAHTTLNDFNIF